MVRPRLYEDRVRLVVQVPAELKAALEDIAASRRPPVTVTAVVVEALSAFVAASGQNGGAAS